MTKDNVSASVTAVVYYRVVDPKQSVMSVENPDRAVSQLMATQLRDILCALEFDSILVQRSQIGPTCLKFMNHLANLTLHLRRADVGACQGALRVVGHEGGAGSDEED